MRIKKFQIALFTMAALFCSAVSYAAGIGGYFTTHYGSYKWNIDESIDLSDSTFGGISSPSQSRPVILGGGLIWDTNLAADRIFNFRQNIGFESFNSSQLKLTQFSLTTTFGFSPVRTRLLRFWLGPQLNLQYRWGKDAHSYYAAHVLIPAYPGAIYKIKRKYEFFSVGTGLALGLNFNVHKNVTIGLETGIQIATSLWGKGKDIARIDASCWGYEGYVSVSVLGRFNDEYASSQ